MKIPNTDHLPVKEQYHGYCIDLIKNISNILEFKYELRLVNDSKHGRRNERGEWNGMIKELIEGVRTWFSLFYWFIQRTKIIFSNTKPFLESGHSSGRLDHHL